MALNDLTRISTSGIATGSSLSGAILHGDAHFRGTQVGVTSALFDSSDDALEFNDNVKLTFGNGGDLQVYHTGNNSIIRDQGTGSLSLQSNGTEIALYNSSNDKYMGKFANNAQVELYHAGNKKIETTKHGAVVTGILTATEFSGPLSNPSGISTFYDLKVTNNLTVEGTTTTLDTNLIGVDRIEVGANSNSIVGVAITQSGTADILNLYDGSTEVFSVADGGNVTTSGTLKIANNAPSLIFDDQNHSIDFTFTAEANQFKLTDSSNGDRVSFNSTGSVSFSGGVVVVPSLQCSTNVQAEGNVNIGDSIVHIGDTNTKIRFPVADAITAETAGSERLRINSTGQIITNGNANPFPTRALTLRPNASQTNNYLSIIAGNTSSVSGVTFGTSADNNANNYRAMFEYYHSAFAHNEGLRFLAAGTEALRIRGGTSNAGDILYGPGDHVVGASPGLINGLGSHNNANVASVLYGIDDGGGYNGMKVINFDDGTYNSQKIQFLTGKGGVSMATVRATIDENGRVGVGTDIPLSGLHISDGTAYGSPQNPSRKATLTISAGSEGSSDIQLLSANYNHIFFGDSADPNTGIIWYEHTGGGTDSMHFSTAGTEKLNITSGGTVHTKMTGTAPTWLGNTIACREKFSIFQGANFGEACFNIDVDNANSFLSHNMYYDGGWKIKKSGSPVRHLEIGTDGWKFMTGADGSDNTGSALTERFRITGSGEVLIGGTSEKVRITSGGEVLIGGIRTSNTGFGNKVLISGGTLGLDGNGDDIGMHWHRTSGDTEGYIGIGDWAVTGGAADDFGMSAKGNLLFGTSSSTWAQKMRIADNGRVKIGTGAPKAQLDIKQQGNSWEDALLIQHDNANTGWNIHAERTNSALWIGYNSNTAAALTDQSASQVLHLHSNRTTSLVTSNNSYELTIGGKGSGSSGGPTLWLRDSGTSGTPRILFGDTAAATKGAIYYSNSNNYMALYTNGNEHIRIDSSGHFYPYTDATRDLGTTSKRWRNVYTTDLQLSNENTGGNEVDGTEGNWTLQEGESDIYMINRKTGKKYKMMLQEVS